MPLNARRRTRVKVESTAGTRLTKARINTINGRQTSGPDTDNKKKKTWRTTGIRSGHIDNGKPRRSRSNDQRWRRGLTLALNAECMIVSTSSTRSMSLPSSYWVMAVGLETANKNGDRRNGRRHTTLQLRSALSSGCPNGRTTAQKRRSGLTRSRGGRLWAASLRRRLIRCVPRVAGGGVGDRESRSRLVLCRKNFMF